MKLAPSRTAQAIHNARAWHPRPAAVRTPDDYPGITVDTREAKPFIFPAGVRLTVKKLDAGDYAVTGLETRAAIERKSCDDFAQSLVDGRLQSQAMRLRDLEYAAIVVEGSTEDVVAHRYVSQVKPSALLGAAARITVSFGVPVFFAGSRDAAAALTLRLLRAFASSAGDARRKTRRDALELVAVRAGETLVRCGFGDVERCARFATKSVNGPNVFRCDPHAPDERAGDAVAELPQAPLARALNAVDRPHERSGT